MGGSARTYVMVGVAVVAAVAAPYLAPYIAEGLGTVLIGAEATGIGIEGAITAVEIANAVAPALSGAATGAIAGGANAELSGGDPWEGAFTGAVAGGVGSAVSGAVGGLLPEGTPSPVSAGVRGAASGFTSAELRGKNLETALATGLISGGTAGLTSALMPTGFLSGGQTAEDYVVDEEGMFVYDEKGNPVLTEDAKTSAKLADIAEKTARGFGGAYIKQNLSSLFDPQPTTGQDRTSTTTRTQTPGYTTPSTGYTPTGQTYQVGSTGGYSPSTATTTGQSGQTPGSQALAQALRVGDPGESIESPAGLGQQQNVWNTASLRVKDETGSEV